MRESKRLNWTFRRSPCLAQLPFWAGKPQSKSCSMYRARNGDVPAQCMAVFLWATRFPG
jgi:hypothetical protein